MDELWLGILLGQEVLWCSMIRVYYHLSTNQVGYELVANTGAKSSFSIVTKLQSMSYLHKRWHNADYPCIEPALYRQCDHMLNTRDQKEISNREAV